MTWDPQRYLTYADERGRPFVDLVGRIDAPAPGSVVDLGCGPGNLTALLKERWPAADVLGLDSSPEMIASATAPGVRFEVADLRTYDGSADVIVSNATLQWVPDHLDRLPGLADRARSWFAFQVPGNFDEPTHTLRRELAADPRFSSYVDGVEHPDAHDAATYLDALAPRGWTVDAWETTYLHVLSGPDPVFTWVSATGARPTLQAVPEPLRTEFATELKALLGQAYPTRPDGTVLMPFRRIFVVAHR